MFCDNHERTPFVKYVVPMFKYLNQETNLIDFSWCKKGMVTQDMAVLDRNDFVLNLSDKKYADSLGMNTITYNEEFFVECSSEFEKEKVSHLLDGMLKLLVECSDSLLSTIKHNKASSIHTMVKKVFVGYTMIKQTLTLTKMALSKSGKWKLIDMRCYLQSD